MQISEISLQLWVWNNNYAIHRSNTIFAEMLGRAKQGGAIREASFTRLLNMTNNKSQ